MVVIATMRDTLCWRTAHRGRITPSDSTALLARPESKRHRALIDRLVLDFEGVPQHTDEHVDPWHEAHEEHLLAALACYRARYPDQSLSTDAAFVQHDTHTWLGASPHGLIDGGSSVLLLRPHKSLRALRHPRDNKAEHARIQLMMFVTGATTCVVADHWDGANLVPDKLIVSHAPAEPLWLLGNVFPRCVALWKRVRAALDARARTSC